jgi:hypothetical protein
MVPLLPSVRSWLAFSRAVPTQSSVRHSKDNTTGEGRTDMCDSIVLSLFAYRRWIIERKASLRDV